MNSDNSIRFSVGLLDRSSDKEKASRYGRMAQCTKAGGWTAKPMVKAVSSMLMVMYMTERGSMIRLMVMVSIAIWMGLNTKVIGRKISSMVKVLRLGQMEPNMKDFGKTICLMEEVSFCMSMVINMKGIGKEIKLMDTENILIVITEQLMRVTGAMTFSTVKASNSGTTIQDTKANTKKV